MRLAVRLAVAVLAVVALAGLGVHYGATYDEHWPHPSGDQLGDDYDAFVGERILLIGEVSSVDAEADTVVVRVTDSADEVAAEIAVSGVDESVEPGGTVQVYGVLEADRTMDAEAVVVVDRSPAATGYKLGVSVLGILLAVGYFLLQWRPNPRKLAFEPHRPSDDTVSDDRRRTDSDDRDDEADLEVSRDG